MRPADDSEIEILKQQISRQQLQIEELQADIVRINSFSMILQRETKLLRSDRERIVSVVRPLLRALLALKSALRALRPRTYFRQGGAISENAVQAKDLFSDIPDSVVSTREAGAKHVELRAQTIQGYATASGTTELIAVAGGQSVREICLQVRNFISANFNLTNQSGERLICPQDLLERGRSLDKANLSLSLEVGGVGRLEIRKKNALNTIFFPAILTGASPSFDVVVPVHNDRPRLRRSVTSILSQSYAGVVNVIVVDDASSDRPEEALVGLERVRFIRLDNNLGAYSARNAALAVSQSDFVTFQDSDDVSLPYRLARTWRMLNAGEADLYVGSYLRLGPQGQVISTNGVIFRRGLILTSGKRSLVWGKLGGFDRVRGGADSEFIERAVRLGLEIVEDDVVTYLANHGDSGLTLSGPLRMWDRKGRHIRNENRENYVAAYRTWHQSGSLDESSVPHIGDLRKFSVPPSVLDGSWHSAVAPTGCQVVDEPMQRYKVVASPFGTNTSWAKEVEAARKSEKPVTVVVVSNRGGQFVENTFQQIRAFNYCNLQILYIANSASSVVSREILGTDIKQFEIESSKNLGHCLNFASSVADGDYLLKIDDDDFYGSDYVAEAVAALNNGYDFVGKSSIFYQFTNTRDLVLYPINLYLHHVPHVSGATLAISRKLVQELRFSERLVRGVDSDFNDRARAAGVPLFATSPFNFAVGRRRDAQHTWNITLEKLLSNGGIRVNCPMRTILEPDGLAQLVASTRS